MSSENSHMEVCSMKVSEIKAPEMVAKYERVDADKKAAETSKVESTPKVETN